MKRGTCWSCCETNVDRIPYPSGDGIERMVCAPCVEREGSERGGVLMWVTIAACFYGAAALSYFAFWKTTP